MATLIPKPDHLSEAYASQFQDRSLVEAYVHRPPYPLELFSILTRLAGERPRIILDLGCGNGAVARGMCEQAERIDAVDVSQAMLRSARQLPGGDHRAIRWIHGAAEDAALNPPYSLVTAGASLHWMDWYRVLPRIKQALKPGGVLAIFGDEQEPPPWADELRSIIAAFSTNRDFKPYDLIDELTRRRLFEEQGRERTPVVQFSQSIDSYIESFHARNGFSRERMGTKRAEEFDAEVRKLVERFSPGGSVTLHTYAEVVWGVPCDGAGT